MKENKGWKQKKPNARGKSESYYEQLRKELVPGVFEHENPIPIEELESQTKFKDFIKRVKTKLEDDYKKLKEGSSEKDNKPQNVTVSKTSGGGNFRGFYLGTSEEYKKENHALKEKMAKLQQRYNTLHTQHQKLQQSMKIRQETYIRREARMKTREDELNRKLVSATTFQRNELDDVEYTRLMKILRGKKRMIQKGIEKLQGETVGLISKREGLFNDRIREMERRFKQNLEEERKMRYWNKKDVIEKSRLLQKNVFL